MLEKLKPFYDELQTVENQMADSSVIADQQKYQVLVRRRIQLQPRAAVYYELKLIEDTLLEAEMMLKEDVDGETHNFLKEELAKYKVAISAKDKKDDLLNKYVESFLH